MVVIKCNPVQLIPGVDFLRFTYYTVPPGPAGLRRFHSEILLDNGRLIWIGEAKGEHSSPKLEHFSTGG